MRLLPGRSYIYHTMILCFALGGAIWPTRRCTVQKVVGIALAVVIGIVVFNMQRANDAAVDAEIDALHALVLVELRGLECYPKHEDFLLETAGRAHEVAASAAYSPGGRRRSASFDRAMYLEMFMRTLKNAAKLRYPADQQLDQNLRQLEIDLEAA